MRHFRRYRLSSLLIGISLVAILMGWWVSWPSRTARSFAKAVAARDTQRLSKICPGRDVFDEYDLGGPSIELTCRVNSIRKKTLSDAIHAKGHFVVTVRFVKLADVDLDHQSIEIEVVKGRVDPKPPIFVNSFPLAQAKRLKTIRE